MFFSIKLSFKSHSQSLEDTVFDFDKLWHSEFLEFLCLFLWACPRQGLTLSNHLGKGFSSNFQSFSFSSVKKKCHVLGISVSTHFEDDGLMFLAVNP